MVPNGPEFKLRPCPSLTKSLHFSEAQCLHLKQRDKPWQGPFIRSSNIYQELDMRQALGIEQQTKGMNSPPPRKEVNRYCNLLLWGLGRVFAKHWHLLVTA